MTTVIKNYIEIIIAKTNKGDINYKELAAITGIPHSTLHRQLTSICTTGDINLKTLIQLESIGFFKETE